MTILSWPHPQLAFTDTRYPHLHRLLQTLAVFLQVKEQILIVAALAS